MLKLSLLLDECDWNDVGENGWKAAEILELEGEAQAKCLEFLNGGMERFEERMDDTVDSVGDSIEEESDC